MNEKELKRLLEASLRPVAADPGALHTACLYLKDYCDQLLAPQQLTVPQRTCYWQACVAIYQYLRQNRCLRRRQSDEEHLHSLAVYSAVDRTEHQLTAGRADYVE